MVRGAARLWELVAVARAAGPLELQYARSLGLRSVFRSAGMRIACKHQEICIASLTSQSRKVATLYRLDRAQG